MKPHDLNRCRINMIKSNTLLSLKKSSKEYDWKVKTQPDKGVYRKHTANLTLTEERRSVPSIGSTTDMRVCCWLGTTGSSPGHHGTQTQAACSHS